MPETRIAHSDAQSITIRGKSLTGDIIGQKSFTQMVYFLTCGREPDATQTRVLDACLVTLMEHGFTPSSLIARLAADSVPDQVQLAMAAGLLAVGGKFVGTMEGCAQLLSQGVQEPDPQAWCRSTAESHLAQRTPIPGFGHPFHKPDDPRTPKLFEVAREAGVKGHYIDLLQRLSRAVDEAAGKHITINATGAIGALLLEIDLPVSAMRAMAVISRCGGLGGHVIEEAETGSARTIWKLAEENIPYVGDA